MKLILVYRKKVSTHQRIPLAVVNVLFSVSLLNKDFSLYFLHVEIRYRHTSQR